MKNLIAKYIAPTAVITFGLILSFFYHGILSALITTHLSAVLVLLFINFSEELKKVRASA